MANWPYCTQRWQRLRMVQLIEQPCCVYCENKGDVTIATLVDHIVPVREARDKAFDQSNLQSLCASCHSSTKQIEEGIRRDKGCGADGIPRRGWE